MKKIAGLIGIVILLSLAGEKLSSAIYQLQSQSLGRSFELILKNCSYLVLINVLFYFLESVRIKLIGKIFKLSISWKDCFGGVALNLLFGWLSPLALLGAPAMAWYFYKRGHPIVESISVSFVRSFSIILISALTTIVIYTWKLQGPVSNSMLQEKVFQVLSGIAIYIGSLVGLSYLPRNMLKKFKVLDKVTSQIRILLEHGKFLMVPVLVLTFLLNVLLVSFIMIEGNSHYKEFIPLFSQAMMFLSYMLLMPTPGASGLAEVGAPLIFGSEIPGAEVISIVTALRIATIGIQVTVGLAFMALVMKQKLDVDEIRLFKKQNL